MYTDEEVAELQRRASNPELRELIRLVSTAERMLADPLAPPIAKKMAYWDAKMSLDNYRYNHK